MSKYNKTQLDGQVWLNVAAGIVIGFAVGSALALLFAPQSGAQLRGDIGDRLDELKEKAEKAVDDLQISTAELLDRSRDVVEQTRENLIRSVEAGKEAYVHKKDELAAQLEP